jgi:hypothetical protein
MNSNKILHIESKVLIVCLAAFALVYDGSGEIVLDT